ncbi:MAG: hypothetical protein OXI25_06655 [Chloroflexota bacterium]|nr:hypothetical protein [Chloroflexota bacterium]
MTLGNVGRPSAAEFAGQRKLLLVPFVSAAAEEQDDGELRPLVERYWSEAAEQVGNLERQLGSVTRLYHEGAVAGGEAELALLERANPAAYPFVKATVERGAELQATEDAETLLEAIDLQRCLLVVQGSRAVAERLHEWLADARKRRYDAIARAVGDTLPPGGVGLLVISQDHQVQFPPDVRVFYVAPPALDQLDRWLRNRLSATAPTENAGAATDDVEALADG